MKTNSVGLPALLRGIFSVRSYLLTTLSGFIVITMASMLKALSDQVSGTRGTLNLDDGGH